MITKPYLDPHDRMKLEAARERYGPLPTIEQYNRMVESPHYCGSPIKLHTMTQVTDCRRQRHSVAMRSVASNAAIRQAKANRQQAIDATRFL